jgi:hypothetical protein
MKTTKSQLKQILKEETISTLGEIQVSQQDFKNMNPRDALRVSGGDDKDLRKAIADFITMGGENRQEVLAKAIGNYQYSDPYLVNLARAFLAKSLATSSREERIKVAKNVERQMNEYLQNSRLKNIIKEELKKIIKEEKSETSLMITRIGVSSDERYLVRWANKGAGQYVPIWGDHGSAWKTTDMSRARAMKKTTEDRTALNVAIDGDED